MKVAIMQPYFFPYLPYFQLISSVDLFVIYDDVNYIKQGWINRNKINLRGVEHYLTLEINGSSSFKKINELTIGKNRTKILETIRHAYINAPYYDLVGQIISTIINNRETLLSKYLHFLILELMTYLNIQTEVILSSEIIKNNSLSGQERVLDICKQLNATTYVNSIGGEFLYNKTVFQSKYIDLKFLKSTFKESYLINQKHVANLSIIDVLMHKDVSDIESYLKEYYLI